MHRCTRGYLGTLAAVGRTEQFGHLTVVVLAVAAVAVPASALLGRTVPSQGATAEATDGGDAGNRDLVEHVACDLRSRLDDVRLLTDTLADGVVRDADEAAEFLDGIRRKTTPMVSTVEELFRYCRATSTALRLEHSPLSLEEIISDAVAAEAPIVRTAGVQVVARDHDRWPTVSGSAGELSRIARTLLVDAVRYTTSGGWLEVSAGVDRAGAWLRVHTRHVGSVDPDTAPGAGSREPGVALALATAHALAEAHGGRLVVSGSGPDRRLELFLPVHRPRRRAWRCGSSPPMTQLPADDGKTCDVDRRERTRRVP